MKYVLVVPWDPVLNKMLMVDRTTDPYKGKLAFPGGKIEQGESKFRAGARELEEETGLRVRTSQMYHIMKHSLPLENSIIDTMVVFVDLSDVSRLKQEKHPIVLIDSDRQMSDPRRFADPCEIVRRTALMLIPGVR